MRETASDEVAYRQRLVGVDPDVGMMVIYPKYRCAGEIIYCVVGSTAELDGSGQRTVKRSVSSSEADYREVGLWLRLNQSPEFKGGLKAFPIGESGPHWTAQVVVVVVVS